MPMSPRFTDVAATVHEWQHMTGPQIDALDRQRTIVILTCSPLEVHGPHLPTVTDNLEAEAIAFRIMERLTLRHPEIEFAHLPPIYTATDVLPHVGSLAFRPSTVVRTLEDVGRSLCKQGFRRIWVTNFHGGPRHFVSIEVAADRVNRRHGGQMVSLFSLLLNRLTGGRTDLGDVLGHIDGLTPEDLAGDSHGGAVETSLMLHLLGRHVAPHAGLPQRTVSIKIAEQGEPPLQSEGRPGLRELMRGFKHKLKYFEDETYAGQPALGSAEIGRQILDELSGLAAEACSDLYTGVLTPDHCRSPLWKARWLFTSAWISRVFERVMKFENRVF